MRSAGSEELKRLLDEQVTYYSALASDYLSQGLDLPGGDEVTEALEAFRPTGSVLELACGPGTWTGQLLRHATDVTAVDASPEMLAIAAARVADERVRFVQADLFTWAPDRRYDVVFIGFWLSHVPLERFESFWSLVADGLTEGGRVFFADDAYRTPDELVEGPSSSTIRRRLEDGTAYRLVKVPHRPPDLENRLRRIGWDIKVTATSGPFYWGQEAAAEAAGYASRPAETIRRIRMMRAGRRPGQDFLRPGCRDRTCGLSRSPRPGPATRTVPQGAQGRQDARGLLSGLRRGDDRHPVRPGRAQRPEVEIRPVIGVLDGTSGGTGTRGEHQVVVGQLEPARPPGGEGLRRLLLEFSRALRPRHVPHRPPAGRHRRERVGGHQRIGRRGSSGPGLAMNPPPH